jgi:DNA-binding response OmpR family regulator
VSWKAPRANGQALAGARILVVDDEPLIALDLTALLAAEGAEVVGPAGSLAEGLRLARLGDVSVALLDVRLGRQSVAPLARLLHEQGVPFAFYTGQTTGENAWLNREWPAAPVVPKPSPGGRLVAAIAALRRPSTAA